LVRFNELRETLQLRLSGEFKRFADEELRAVLTLLAPRFAGSQIPDFKPLLQPERITPTRSRDPDVAGGRATESPKSENRRESECPMPQGEGFAALRSPVATRRGLFGMRFRHFSFVLLAMHQTLVERGLCLRQPQAGSA
jgi:hypothetical protein